MLKVTLLMLSIATLLAVDAVRPLTQQACYLSAGVVEMNARRRANNLPLLNGENDIQANRIGLSRHHIIPFDMLKAFFNTLLRDPNHTYFARLYNDILRPAAEQSQIPLGSLLHMHDIGTPEEVVLANMEGRLTDQTVAQTIFMWLPFNIFIGPSPQFRSDDPRNNFERRAQIIVGEGRLNEIYGVYHGMRSYLRSETTPEQVLDSLTDLTRTQLLPYDFDPRQWLVRNNRLIFCIVVNGNRNIHGYRNVRFDDYYRDDNVNRFPRQVSYSLQSLTRDDLYCLESYAKLKNPAQPAAPAKVVHYHKPKNKVCGDAAAITTATTVGTTTLAYVTCMGLGGLYIPFLGWVSCALGTATYALTVAATGAVVAASTC